MENGNSTPARTAAVMGLGTAARIFPNSPVTPRRRPSTAVTT
jgi:hypothetical protein